VTRAKIRTGDRELDRVLDKMVRTARKIRDTFEDSFDGMHAEEQVAQATKLLVALAEQKQAQLDEANRVMEQTYAALKVMYPGAAGDGWQGGGRLDFPQMADELVKETTWVLEEAAGHDAG
jgi:hypothetical protein